MDNPQQSCGSAAQEWYQNRMVIGGILVAIFLALIIIVILSVCHGFRCG
ncbi:hypothetical protein ACP4OV_015195 [Aristida adscensionis]